MSKLRIKSWVWIWFFQKEWLPLHPMMSHSTAGGSASGVHWKQFIAECGIEYGCQIVTQIFINSPDCLYTKKSWEFLQSYEKNMEICEPMLFLQKNVWLTTPTQNPCLSQRWCLRTGLRCLRHCIPTLGTFYS
jgi:hypothetical protein